MEIQKRIVFAVELEFTLTSPLFCTPRELPREEAAGAFYHLHLLLRRRFAQTVPAEKSQAFVRPMVQFRL